MITIPVAVHNEMFRWQLSLLWFAHRRTYGEQAASKVHAVVIKRNEPESPKAERMEWDIPVPHSMCESFFDQRVSHYHALARPLNIQVGLAQILPAFDDEQVLEVIDCDMLHFRPHPEMEVPEGHLLVSDVYEAWHLRSLSDNRHVVAPYVEDGNRYYNGGFVPIIGHAKTFRRILREWIEIHVDMLKQPHDDLLKWWAGMFALQAACEKAQVKMVARDYCHVPGGYPLTDTQYIGHYCIDRVFNKREYPKVDVSGFPDNSYYAVIKDWLSEVNGNQLEPAPPAPAVKYLPIHDGLLQWIAENRLRDFTSESLLNSMIGARYDPVEARAAIERIEREPGYLAARRMQHLHRKHESVTANLQALWETAPGYHVVEKRTSPSREEFVERYVRGCRPVVLTDVAKDWPAMARWSPDDLKQRFGQYTVDIQDDRNADPKFEERAQQHRRPVQLGAFVDRVMASGPTNDFYMTANNLMLRRPEFAPLLDDIGALPEICNHAMLPQASHFWFGPAGTRTPLHHDTVMLFHTQVVGRKRWRLISPLETPRLYNFNYVYSPIDVDHPDLARYPLFSKVTVLDVVVEPGETLFLPLAWWHQVTSLDICMSLSYTNLNLDMPNNYTFQNPALLGW